MGLTDTPTGNAVVNVATGDPSVQIGSKNTLEIQLVNNSGAAIALSAGSDPATFSLYLPIAFFTVAQQQAIRMTASGWAAAPLDTTTIPGTPILNVQCTQAATWADGATLTFTLDNVETSGPAGNDCIAVEPANMNGNVSFDMAPTLVAVSPPQPGNLKLSDVLQVTLDNQGSVLRSASAADPLTNTLYLTFKNIGATALATGATAAGSPKVYVSFVYGSTSGALAPDGYDPAKGAQPGSAWNISVGIQSAQLPWTAQDPRWDQEKPHPQWTLAPAQTNLQILGPAGSDEANVTFAFSDIVSVTPTGHTQMLVQCEAFARDDKTAYDTQLYVLDILKVDAPPTRGLLSFFGPDPVILVSNPTATVKIPLRWSMLDVASVRLLTSSAATTPLTRNYAVPPKPLDYDSATVTVPTPQTSEAVFCTLQAFDAGGGYLNSQQFTAYTQVSYVIDAAGTVYPIGLFGDTFWMLENYRYPAAGSYDYGNVAANDATFGRLYGAAVQPPAGWSLPTAADWSALFARFASAGDAYSALVAGGGSGFNAELGGWRTIQSNGSGTFTQQYVYGYYWAGGNVCAQFSSVSGKTSVGTPVSNTAAGLSVRFIRHA
jgi:uncharacterized protein (TIGR02145 family)